MGFQHYSYISSLSDFFSLKKTCLDSICPKPQQNSEKKSRSSSVASFSNFECIIVMPLTHPNKYTALSQDINRESFDHWSLPVLLAGCNYSETGQMLLQIRPKTVYLLSVYFGEHLLTQLPHCSIDYTSCHLETFHLHHNFSWLGSTRMFLSWQEELEEKK